MAFIEEPHHLQRIDTGKLRLRSKILQKLAVLRMKSSLLTLTKNLEEMCEVALVRNREELVRKVQIERLRSKRRRQPQVLVPDFVELVESGLLNSLHKFGQALFDEG